MSRVQALQLTRKEKQDFEHLQKIKHTNFKNLHNWGISSNRLYTFSTTTENFSWYNANWLKSYRKIRLYNFKIENTINRIKKHKKRSIIIHIDGFLKEHMKILYAHSPTSNPIFNCEIKQSFIIICCWIIFSNLLSIFLVEKHNTITNQNNRIHETSRRSTIKSNQSLLGNGKYFLYVEQTIKTSLLNQKNYQTIWTLFLIKLIRTIFQRFSQRNDSAEKELENTSQCSSSILKSGDGEFRQESFDW